jgi:phosphoribosylformimino-5-aminoimidazole carboxamide ribotide isomerase
LKIKEWFMILVIPALQLIDGVCSLFIKGEEGTESLYSRLSENPIELCKLWRRENAKTIHITDYDSNYSTSYSNLDSIIYLADAIDIPFQVLAKFRSIKECEYLLNNGIYRIAFGELSFADPKGVAKLIEKYSPSRVVGYIQTRFGKVNFSQMTNAFTAIEFINYLKELGFKRIIYKEEEWLNKSKGVDFEILNKIGMESKIRVTLFEGITEARQMWQLNESVKYGIDSIVMGQALYDNNFPCQKVWRLIEADLEK